jgi:hypothetical protein
MMAQGRFGEPSLVVLAFRAEHPPASSQLIIGPVLSKIASVADGEVIVVKDPSLSILRPMEAWP